MEFTVAIDTRTADLARIEEALRGLDPAALVGAQPGRLRIAGAFDVATLSGALRDAGCIVSEPQIQPLPSVCCGGCGG